MSLLCWPYRISSNVLSRLVSISLSPREVYSLTLSIDIIGPKMEMRATEHYIRISLVKIESPSL